MSLIWKINGSTLESLGLSLVSGAFRTHGTSTMTLRRSSKFDTAELTGLEYGDDAELTYDAGSGDVRFFFGKVSTVPKFGSGGNQGQTLEIEDAWADLERTIYQEEWLLPGPDTVMMPRAVFGMDASGTPITVGAMIAQVVTAAGLDLAVDVDVTGEIPLPSEIVNQTCAEIILQCLKLHPDWVPYIDHSTSPNPTFRVIALSAASSTSISVAGSGGVQAFDLVRREDLLPECVRIVYESASETDGNVYRTYYLDEYPTSGVETSGPKVIQAYIPLQGRQVQIQKSRIQVRAIPDGTDDEATKTWLKLHFPQIKDVPDDHFSLAFYTRTYIDDSGEEMPGPINPESERLSVTDVDDLPNELVRGSIEDWMRVRVGKVSVEVDIKAAGACTAAEKKLMGHLGPIQVTGTNATTKLYKGLSNWIAAEDVPTGVAQTLYDGLHAGIPYQGSVTVVAQDVSQTSFIGKKLNLTGGVTEWATMAAPISAVDWNVADGSATIAFGPPGYLAPRDFLELQRLLSRRPVRWFAPDERTADTHGSESSASSTGDTVDGHDHPGGNGGIIGGRNLNLTINHWIETTLGGLDTNGSDTYLIWRDGRFAGTTDPGDSPDDLVEKTVSEVLPAS